MSDSSETIPETRHHKLARECLETAKPHLVSAAALLHNAEGSLHWSHGAQDVTRLAEIRTAQAHLADALTLIRRIMK